MVERIGIGSTGSVVAGALAIAAGVLLGVGAFTFHYAEGFSYFSQDPAACVNCHIMRPQYDSWHKASHGRVATCVDCHLPHTFPHDIIAKADNGWHHSWAFTFQDFPEPIQIKPRNQRILEENCVRCHAMLVHAALVHHQPVHRDDRLACVGCHTAVGHGPRR